MLRTWHWNGAMKHKVTQAAGRILQQHLTNKEANIFKYPTFRQKLQATVADKKFE
jgi:hypothetical protein